METESVWGSERIQGACRKPGADPVVGPSSRGRRSEHGDTAGKKQRRRMTHTGSRSWRKTNKTERFHINPWRGENMIRHTSDRSGLGWRGRWCYLFSRWNAVPSLVPLPPGPAALSPSAPLGEGTSTTLFFTSSKLTLHVQKHSVKTTVSATVLDFSLPRSTRESPGHRG